MSVLFLVASLVVTPIVVLAQEDDAPSTVTVSVREYALRETAALDHWHLVELDDEGTSRPFVEMERFAIASSPPEIEAAGFADRFVDVLIGQIVGQESYLVGVLGAPGSGQSSQDRSFIVLAETRDLSQAGDLARAFADLHGTAEVGGRHLFCPCEDCQDQLETDNLLCAAEAGACQAAILSWFTACVLGCGGIPVCEGACLLGFIAGEVACTVQLVQCQRAAVRSFLECEATCNP